MNITRIMVLSFLFLTGIFVNANIYADETSDAIAYHENLATSYEAKAMAQDTSIAEHKQMKEDYKKKSPIHPKFDLPKRVREMNKHCDAIIHETGKLKNQFLDFAEWHRMRAAELKGQ